MTNSGVTVKNEFQTLTVKENMIFVHTNPAEQRHELSELRLLHILHSSEVRQSLDTDTIGHSSIHKYPGPLKTYPALRGL